MLLQSEYNTLTMEERIQKIMSKAGLGSRRACEELIMAGRVSVNGKTAEIGQKADPHADKIVVDGRQLNAPEALTYIALHKPRNVLSAAEPEPGDTRKTVRDLISLPGHLYPVGRLDFDSEGLVLMTNDGDLTNKLTHPRFGHLKIYRVLVARRPDDEQLATWRRGVVLEDGYKTAPCEVALTSTAGKGAWLKITMREGRKRQIREIGSLLGLPVVRIVRVAIGALRLDALKPGEWRALTAQEIAELKSDSTPKRAPLRPGRRPTHDRDTRTERPHASPPLKERALNERRKPATRPASDRPGRPAAKPSPRPSTGRQPPPSGPKARPTAPRKTTRPTTSRNKR